MKILKSKHTTRILAEEQDEFRDLPILDENGAMNSYWQLTEEELALLNKTKVLQLNVIGISHPPVSIDVISEEVAERLELSEHEEKPIKVKKYDPKTDSDEALLKRLNII